MNQPSKMGKRIVSKGAYVKAHGQRASMGILAIVLLGMMFVCGLITLAYRVSEVIVTASQSNSHTQFVPLREWDFSTGNFDGPRQVTIRRKYGFIEVTTIYPR
jgi:hypothetical protein